MRGTRRRGCWRASTGASRPSVRQHSAGTLVSCAIVVFSSALIAIPSAWLLPTRATTSTGLGLASQAYVTNNFHSRLCLPDDQFGGSASPCKPDRVPRFGAKPRRVGIRNFITRGSGASAPAEDARGSSGAWESSLNLAKNLVGSGMLSLPAGVAAFSASPNALLVSLLLLTVTALLSAYGFYLIGRTCEATNATTFGTAWERSMKGGAWAPQLICILECLGGSVVYAMVLGDVFASLIGQVSFLPAVMGSRWAVIATLGATVLYPLCCLRSFKQLAKFSLLGTLASCFVGVFVGKRYFDGSYAPGGKFFDASAWPVLDAASSGTVLNVHTLFLVSILATAYLMHFNAPQMWTELEGDSSTEEGSIAKRRRFALVAVAGFGLAAAQYAIVMCFGFLTFGRAVQGNVLSNYAAADSWAIAARAAVGLSTLFGYPMQFAGFRDGLLEARGVTDLTPEKRRLFTAALLAAVCGAACLLRDLGKFQAFEGALLAVFLIYIAPALMASRLWGGRVAKVRFGSLVVAGIVMGVVGGVVTLGLI